jgi:hypothetical protein
VSDTTCLPSALQHSYLPRIYEWWLKAMGASEASLIYEAFCDPGTSGRLLSFGRDPGEPVSAQSQLFRYCPTLT